MEETTSRDGATEVANIHDLVFTSVLWRKTKDQWLEHSSRRSDRAATSCRPFRKDGRVRYDIQIPTRSTSSNVTSSRRRS